MSFLGFETSRDSGKPIELFEVITGTRRVYFTSGRKQIMRLGVVYMPVAMKRSAIEITREFAKSTVSVTVPGTLDFPQAIMREPPEALSLLTIYRIHEGDTEFATFWTGRVTGVSFSGSDAVIKCESIYTTLRSQGRRKTYSMQCNWTLYRQGCNVNDSAYAESSALTAVSGASIGLAALGAQPSGYFTGGSFKVTIGDQEYYRRIDAHVGGAAMLNAAIPGLANGQIATVYPGCNHSFAQCRDRFNNTINYGGFPWKPLKDPFSGSSSF